MMPLQLLLASDAALVAFLTFVDVVVPHVAALTAPSVVFNAIVSARVATAPKPRKKCSNPRSPLSF